MELWSKGLGRMVLAVRLADCNEMQADGDRAVIRGTMGEPVYWGYAVTLTGDDVLDFIRLLEQPAAVGFVVTSRHRWKILGSALRSVVVFAGAIATRALASRVPRRGATASPPPESEAATQENHGRKTDVQQRS